MFDVLDFQQWGACPFLAQNWQIQAMPFFFFAPSAWRVLWRANGFHLLGDGFGHDRNLLRGALDLALLEAPPEYVVVSKTPPFGSGNPSLLRPAPPREIVIDCASTDTLRADMLLGFLISFLCSRVFTRKQEKKKQFIVLRLQRDASGG